MKNKKNKNLRLNFEKTTISRLMQTTIKGGANNAAPLADEGKSIVCPSTDKTKSTCDYTGCN